MAEVVSREPYSSYGHQQRLNRLSCFEMSEINSNFASAVPLPRNKNSQQGLDYPTIAESTQFLDGCAYV